MNKQNIVRFSEHLNRNMGIRIYGYTGRPILVLPTQDAMSDNFENFGMIDTLAEYIDGGKVQLFCLDTVDSETWSNTWGDKEWRANRQEAYYNCIIEDIWPFLTVTNGTNRLPLVIGCSLGGLHAAILFLRRPEKFAGMLSLSGILPKWPTNRK